MNTIDHTEILNDISFPIMDDHKKLCHGLGEYVLLTCGSRDSSHGYEHMKNVARNSIYIYNKMYEDIKLTTMNKNKFFSLLLTISWLHDVADKKYDHYGDAAVQLRLFIQSMFGDDVDLILNTILRTSYSNEINMINEYGELDWSEKLGKDGLILRNIVSDADKLEAIGLQGVYRCMTYNLELLKKKSSTIVEEELIENVKKHADIKLLKLSEKFIKTPIAKEMAIALHNEMVNILADENTLKVICGEIIQSNSN